MVQKTMFLIRNWAGLLISIAIAEGIGLLSAVLSGSFSGVYQNLAKPGFAPPPWIFGVVWPMLFLLMGIAAYRIWMLGTENPEVREALWLYGIQLMLNFWWSIIFFRWEQRGLALIEILLLWVFILMTTVKFYRLDRIAGLLMVPYLLWVSFAAVLNYAVWRLNRNL